MGSAASWRTDCCSGICRSVGRCLAWAGDGRAIIVGIDDLAPSIAPLYSAAIVRCVDQWDNADDVESKADGIIRGRLRILVRGGGLEPPHPKDTNT